MGIRSRIECSPAQDTGLVIHLRGGVTRHYVTSGAVPLPQAPDGRTTFVGADALQLAGLLERSAPREMGASASRGPTSRGEAGGSSDTSEGDIGEGARDSVKASHNRTLQNAATRLRGFMASCGVLSHELGKFGATGPIASFAARTQLPVLLTKTAATCRQLIASQLLCASSQHRPGSPPLSIRAPPLLTSPVIGDRTPALQVATRAAGWEALRSIGPDLPLPELQARLWRFLSCIPAWGVTEIQNTAAVGAVLSVAATLATRWAAGGAGNEWAKRRPSKHVTYVDGSEPGIPNAGRGKNGKLLITMLNGEAASPAALAAMGIGQGGSSGSLQPGRGAAMEAREGSVLARRPGTPAAGAGGRGSSGGGNDASGDSTGGAAHGGAAGGAATSQSATAQQAAAPTAGSVSDGSSSSA